MIEPVFLSHSGDREGVALLATELRRHGMRPWRDVDSLPLGARTRAQIENDLARCRAAMIWLTNTTLQSAYVTQVEVPAIYTQHERRGLTIIPIFIDWPPGADASNAFRAATGHEIGDHNGYHIDPTKPFEQEIAAIAGDYTRAALQDRASTNPGQQPVVRFATRTNAAGGLQQADLNLDWTAEYPSSGKLPDLQTTASLQRALARAADELINTMEAGDLEVHARCHLHLGIALGHAFRRPTGMIPRIDLNGESWPSMTSGGPEAPTPLQLTTSHGPVTASRASVEASITRDVSPGVDRTIAAAGAIYRTRTRLRPNTGPSQTAVTNPPLANAWAEQIADSVRTASREPGIADVDLYISAPIQLAVLLGWRLNAAGRIHLHHWIDNTGPYQKVWTLPPS